MAFMGFFPTDTTNVSSAMPMIQVPSGHPSPKECIICQIFIVMDPLWMLVVSSYGKIPITCYDCHNKGNLLWCTTITHRKVYVFSCCLHFQFEWMLLTALCRDLPEASVANKDGCCNLLRQRATLMVVDRYTETS